MPASYEEVLTLHNRLVAEHGAHAVALASMMLDIWSSLPDRSRDSSMRILMPCVHARMRELRITTYQLESTLRALDRANSTLQMLSVLDW